MNDLRTLQREYFAIYDELIGTYLSEARDIRGDKLHSYINRKVEKTVACVLRGVTVSAFDVRLSEFAKAIEDFWRSNADDARRLTRALPGWSLQFPYPEYRRDVSGEATKLLAYFDTLVLFDNIIPWSRIDLRDDMDLQSLRTNFRRAALIDRLRRLCFAETAIPMVVILPEGTDDVSLKMADVASQLSEYFHGAIPTGDVRELIREISTLSDRAANDYLLRACNEPRFRAAVERVKMGDFPFYWDVSDGAVWPVGRRTSQPTQVVLRTALVQTAKDLSNTLMYQHETLAVGADPLLGGDRLEVEKYLLEHGAATSWPREPFSEQELAAVAVQRPEVQFLSTLSVADLADARKNAGLEDIRSAMRISRSKIKTLPLEYFTETAIDAANSLIDAMAKLGEELERSRELRVRHRWRDAGSMLAGAAVAVASIAVPILTIPATVFSVGIGSESVRGLINGALAENAMTKHQMARPLGVLLAAKQRAEFASRAKSPPNSG